MNDNGELKFFDLHCYHQTLQTESGRWSNSWNQHMINCYTVEDAVRLAEEHAKAGWFLLRVASERGDRVKLIQLMQSGVVVHSWKSEKGKRKKSQSK